MENHRIRPGIAEVTEQAYAIRHGTDAESRQRHWNTRTKITVMTVISIIIGSLILYWFVSSILENRRGGCAQSLEKSDTSKRSYLKRLPNHVLPLEYTLKIVPILEEGNFTAIGEVQIRVRCKTPVKHIRLHARKLSIREIALRESRSSNASKSISKYVVSDEGYLDMFFLHLLMPSDTYVLTIKYTLQLTEEPCGLFRSGYADPEANRTRWIAVSNLSPDYARWAFPCFDEPWMKAPFRISIGRTSGMLSHSNSVRTVTEEIRDMPGYVWDHYEKTLPMPTYVVAFMVTDFPGYKISVQDRPSHTIFSRKGAMKDTKYIGNLIPGVLRSIQNLTGVPYQLDKLDAIVLPGLAYSAMENWGLLTFREDFMLINDIDTEERKKSLANIAAHEVAHQWFGNLVTPNWWDVVWLKEGFSSFFGNLALSMIQPSWRLEEMFIVEIRDVLASSADENAHPLRINLTTVKRLDSVFDMTSYVKGNCVVYMIFHFLGKTTFLSAIRGYVRSHRYGSVDQEDVWNAFQEEIDLKKSLPRELTMSGIMRSWTDQAGFPILQDRFYSRGLNGTSKESWYIPLTWTTENERRFDETLPRGWMTGRGTSINDPSLRRAILQGRWILFNINQTGLHRTNYDVENWRLLAKSYDALPRITKVQLLSDAIAIARAGLIGNAVPWNIIQRLETEGEELLWTTAEAELSPLEHGLWESEAFKFVMCKLLNKAYTLEAASLLQAGLKDWTTYRMKLMKWTCSMGHEHCLSMVRHLSERMLNDTTCSVPTEHRELVYCAYVKAIGVEQWSTLLERYKDSEACDKNSLAYALGCHSNTTLLTRFLSFVFAERDRPKTHVYSALLSVASNPHGTEIAAEHFLRYWSTIREDGEDLSGELHYEKQRLTDVLHAFSIYMDREENVEWLGRLKGVNEDYDSIIDEVINRVEINVAWNRKYKTETLRILQEISDGHEETRDCSRSPVEGGH